MSNSTYINYTRLSPNKTSPRKTAIDTITIHCMAGNLTVENLGAYFASSATQASCNYGVDSKGRIGLYVDEGDRSWCSSNAANDNRAVTIEVANDGGAETGWHVSETAIDALIVLVADICERNGIKQLKWLGDPNLVGQVDKQNMTVHRWFKNKACPGDYLYSKHSYIAAEVNKLLISSTIIPSVPVQPVIQQSTEASVEYLVRIKATALNVRSGPGTNHTVVKTLANDHNAYTIVDEADGSGASRWGKLKSGLGWISLDFVTKL